MEPCRCRFATSPKNIKAKITPCPESVAESLLLTLGMAGRAARPALWTITPNQTAALAVAVGEINDGILPSLERKLRKTSYR